MGAILALASSVCYGFADFAGGLLARRNSFVAVAFAGQLGGLALMMVIAPMTATTMLTAADLGWGALSGVGTGIGMMCLFRGLGRGAMSVVVPVSSVGGVALPILIGVAVLGDRPSMLSWSGVIIVIPALWLVSRTRGNRGPNTTAAVADGLLASVGIGLQYIALAQVGPGSGVWPVLVGRIAAAAAILGFNKFGDPTGLRLRLPASLGALVTGASAALALVCYLLATRSQLVVTAVVLSSLYPLIPVLLGLTALNERLSWRQSAGLAGALAAVGLITVG